MDGRSTMLMLSGTYAETAESYTAELGLDANVMDSSQ